MDDDSNNSLNLEDIKEEIREDLMTPSTPTTACMSTSTRPDNCDNKHSAMGASNNSLSLEDIQEDTMDDIGVSTTTDPPQSPSRPWSEAQSGNARGTNRPIRVSSTIPELEVGREKNGREWLEKRHVNSNGMKKPMRRRSLVDHDDSAVGEKSSDKEGATTSTPNFVSTMTHPKEDDLYSASESSLSVLSLSTSTSTITGVSFFSQSEGPSIDKNMARQAHCAV
jgi:hypothetical protein